MKPSVKPLVHWALFRKYSVRYTARQPEMVEGVFGTPAGSVPFRFAPGPRTLIVDAAPPVTLNEYGWEVNALGEVVIKGYRKSAPTPAPRASAAEAQMDEKQAAETPKPEKPEKPEKPDTTDTIATADTKVTEEIEAADGAGISE